uniref:RHOMBOID-like protein 1 n=1 Tax=Erigeron canadensis TaxID=72917 RepID=UPI001CB89341|nr:RHOMBOID-like protein 1 [Erigeron canadensis]
MLHEFKPFKDWESWLVPTIVSINVVLFLVSLFINNCPAHSDKCIAPEILMRFAFESFKINPLLGPSPSTLVKMGALEYKKVIEEREQWRLVTCMWLHGGVFHVFANMLGLAFLGTRLEKEFGFLKIGVLYVLSGIGGSILSSLYVRTTISVGASGALFGLLGGMLSELLTNWTIYANKIAALATLILIILINVVVGIIPHIDNYAHIGGFFTGFFLGFVILVRPQFKWINQKHVPPGYTAPPTRTKYKIYQYILLILSLIVLLVGFMIGLILISRGVDGNDYCSWCHYLTCMPTPLWTCNAHCRLVQLDKQINMTCQHNGRFDSYILEDANDITEMQRLCLELCS